MIFAATAQPFSATTAATAATNNGSSSSSTNNKTYVHDGKISQTPALTEKERLQAQTEKYRITTVKYDEKNDRNIVFNVPV